jgi:hypothetical protein
MERVEYDMDEEGALSSASTPVEVLECGVFSRILC